MIELVILSVFALFDFSSTNPMDSIPYMASVGTYGQYIGYGAIMSRYHIVATAQRFYGIRNKRFTVKVGSPYYMQGGLEFQVSGLFFHPEYRPPSRDFDTLVIQLTQSLHFTARVIPLALPGHADYIRDGTSLLVTGWGKDTAFRIVQLQAINKRACEKKPVQRFFVTPNMICVSKRGGLNLIADGAIAIANGNLVGLASIELFGNQDLLIFTRLSAIRGWLQQFVIM